MAAGRKQDQRLQIEIELKRRKAQDAFRKGNLTEAETICRSIARKTPDHDASYLLSVICLQTGRFDRAVAAANDAIAANPGPGYAYINKGIALEQLRRFADAVAAYDQAIERLPNAVEAWCNRGIALQELGRFEDAAASLEKASALNPTLPEPWSNLGPALNALGRPLEALAACDKAIALRPDQPEPYCNRGNALRALNRFAEALASYDKAIARQPDHAKAWSNRGVALHRLDRLEEAAASLDKAVAFEPDNADAWYNRGLVMVALKRLDEAVSSFETVSRLKPDFESVPGTLWEARMAMCDWTDHAARTDDLTRRVLAGQKVSPPFTMLAVSDDPAVHRAAAEVWSTAITASVRPAPPARTAINAKPKVGYFSADFRDHATSWLIAGLIEQHDRDRFEISAYAFGKDPGTAIGRRIHAAFDRFVDVTDLTDEAIADRSREDGIDIAIDLNAYTAGCRPGIFACRAAPIQVNYLAYPGTMGVPFIDYIIADPIVIPPDARSHYVEKIAFLPHTYQPNDTTRAIAPTDHRRADLGLPDGGFVFCCLNNNYKITPEVFRLWMTILRRVDRSVLWLLEDNPWAARNLRAAAAAEGIDPARLVFAARVTMPEHLARQRAADLFLDTLPYNAHTTASDALWAGLPVLTRAGQGFAGRVAASVLTAAGLPDLIVETAEDYVAMAVDLAHDPARLKAIRDWVSANRATSPLFDTALYTRHLEAAYSAMLDRHAAGLAPDHLFVAP